MKKVRELLADLKDAREELKLANDKWHSATVHKEVCKQIVKDLEKEIDDAFTDVVEKT